MEPDGKVFQEVDLISVLREIGSKNKTLNARVLQELEKHITDKEEFKAVRSFVLDEQNSYTRSVVRLIFGDIEFDNFSKR
jgi:hypothetical protein